MPITIPGPPALFTSPVGLNPAIERHVPAALALQRLAFREGRTLTESALETEQAWVEARLGLAGRQLTSGIIDGLQISIGDQAAQPGAFSLSAGRAITPNGQDAAVRRPRSLMLADVAEFSGAAGSPHGLFVLLLSPVSIEAENLPDDDRALFAFADGTQADGTAAPYLDFVIQDGAQLTWAGLDAALAGSIPGLAPNIAAEAVRRLEQNGQLPWAGQGAALCLMFAGPDGRIAWQHRAAVARRGGVLPRARLSDLDRLRQSRLDGLIEETARASAAGAWTKAASFLRHMPPAGVLPRKAWDSREFFPAGWAQAQAPIPESQLEAVLEAARAMAPYDISANRDSVKWLVPVPDHLYMPDLLEAPAEPDFAPVTGMLETDIADALQARGGLRAQAKTVRAMLDGASVPNFAAAPDQSVPGEDGFTPAEAPAAPTFRRESDDLLAQAHSLADPGLFSEALRGLIDPAAMALANLPLPFGATHFVSGFRALVSKANNTVDFAYSRVQAEIYRLRQITLDNEEATKLATFPVLAGLAKGSNNYALSEGLRAHFLTSQTVAAAAPAIAAPIGAQPAPRRIRKTLAARRNSAAEIAMFQPLAGSEMLTSIASSESVFNAVSASAAFSPFLASPKNDFAFERFTETPKLIDTKLIVDNARAALVDDSLLTDVFAKRTGILRAAALPGEVRDIRTTTIAERLQASAALQAKASAVRIKADVLRQVQDMGIPLSGLRAPLTSGSDVALLISEDVAAAKAAAGLSAAEATQFDAMRRPVANTGDGRNWELVVLAGAQGLDANGTAGVTPLSQLASALRRMQAPIDLALLPALVLSKQLDPDPAAESDGDDESAFLTSAVMTLESVVAILRVAEARIDAVSAAGGQIEAMIGRMSELQGRFDSALSAAEQDLDEARHDWRVALSLISEERARLAELARRKAKILAEAVKFVAYARPRALVAHKAGDTLGMRLPGVDRTPEIETSAGPANLPEDLETLIEALREIPLGWFAAHEELTQEFVQPQILERTFGGVRARAAAKASARRSRPRPDGLLSGPPAKKAAAKTSAGYDVMISAILQARQNVDELAFAQASWAEKRRQALNDTSLNDLIESGGQARAASRALAEIERIEQVTASLLQALRGVPAGLRLLWVRQLSAYDTVTSLRSLAQLEGWGQADWALRTRLQSLVSWLYARLQASPPQAEALITDLIRVCVLISGHAPAGEIVSARAGREQAISAGAPADIEISRGQARIGMQVAVLGGDGVKARGVISDLYGAVARVQLSYVKTGFSVLTAAHDISVYDKVSLQAALR